MMSYTRLIEILLQSTRDKVITWELVVSDGEPQTLTGKESMRHFETRVGGIYVMVFPRVAEHPPGSGKKKMAIAVVAMGVPGNGRLTSNKELVPGTETPARMAMLLLYLAVRREWTFANQWSNYCDEYGGVDVQSEPYLEKLIPKGWDVTSLLSALS